MHTREKNVIKNDYQDLSNEIEEEDLLEKNNSIILEENEEGELEEDEEYSENNDIELEENQFETDDIMLNDILKFTELKIIKNKESLDENARKNSIITVKNFHFILDF